MIARRLLAALAVALATFVTCLTPVAAQTADPQAEGIYERARIVGIGTETQQTSSTTSQQVEVYRLKFLSGPLEGQERTILNEVGGNPYKLRPSEGDTMVTFLQRGEAPDTWDIYLEGFDRRGALVLLILLFVLMLILLAGWQGVKVALSIGISLGLIGYVLIPAFLAGWNPVPVAILLGGLFTILSCGLATGWNKKALVTAAGTMGGALVAYLLSVAFVDMTHLSGLSTEEDRLFFQKNPRLDPRGLLFAGIIIASVGILEDVAVSIVSGVSEVHRANPRLGFKQLFLSGMVVGRDHMSALANTLIYAYVGASLSSLLLYKQYGQSWLKFMNFDTVVDEVIRSLCGTIGLIFTVPITALLAAWAVTRPGWHKDHATQGTHGHHHPLPPV